MGKRRRPWDFDPQKEWQENLQYPRPPSPELKLSRNELAIRLLARVISEITYKEGFKIHCERDPGMDSVVIRLSFQVQDSVWSMITAKQEVQLTEAIPLETLVEMPETEMVRFIHSCIVKMEMHEIDEFLKYQGNHVTDPHPERRMVAKVISNYNSDYLAQYGNASGSVYDTIRLP